MNNEFKKTKSNNETRYTLESMTAGATGSGSVATSVGSVGKVQKRGNILAQEADKNKVDASKPRNFVAKNAKTGGAGAHKDKKKEQQQGTAKHKKPYMEALKQKIDDLKSRLNEAQGVAEATGDKPFDSMMKTIKKGTARQATADRRDQRKQSQQQARDAFGPNPAAGLGIRKPSVAEGENKQIKGGDPCWKNYKMVGMKPGKGGSKVPNCVPATNEEATVDEAGLWANIHAKRKRIAAGSGEKMRKPGSKGAPSNADLKASAVKEDLKADLKSFRAMIEEASYKVEVEGLPTMYVQSSSPTEVKTNLRKLLRKADMIKSVDRIQDVEVKKAFRLKAMGKDEE